MLGWFLVLFIYLFCQLRLKGVFDSVVIAVEDKKWPLRRSLAQIHSESVVAINFCKEKGHDMMLVYCDVTDGPLWKQVLLVKISELRVKGDLFKWIKDFIIGKFIQLRIWEELFKKL